MYRQYKKEMAEVYFYKKAGMQTWHASITKTVYAARRWLLIKQGVHLNIILYYTCGVIILL